MKRGSKLTIAVILISVLFINMIFPTGYIRQAEAASSDMRDRKASEIVAEMGIGWNLGNTFDSHGSYANGTNYQMVGYYMDGTSYAWSMSSAVPFNKDEDGKSITATLSWQMNSITSEGSSQTNTLGFQIWNFSDNLPKGTELPLEVLKAEIKTGGKTYSFPGLLGKHTVTMDGGGVASFETNEFDSLLSKSSQLKAGTLTLTIKLTPEAIKNKQEYFETLWGNPITTKALIDNLKAAGFNAVRVPVTWFTNMDSKGIVDEAWMDRVEEVVNYILDNDMYCILNLHHDTGHASDYGVGWLIADTSDPAMEKRFASLWEQIATRFRSYNDHLLFESFNEILTQDANGNDIWGYPGSNAITAVNELNQLFVDTVRSSGGNNAKRHLVVNTYAASTTQATIDGFVLPADTIDNHLIVQVHEYTPMEFGYYNISWTEERSTWGTQSDKSNLDAIFERLNKRFISNGIPVIIGEFATCNKNNTIERTEHAGYYVAGARKKGIVCFWWDNGGNFEVGKGETYKESGLINRTKLKWAYPEIVDALIASAYSDKAAVYDLKVSPIAQQTYTGKSIAPAVTVKDGTKTLVLNTDYKSDYSNNKTPGTATISITGMGNYYGITEIAFIILPGKVSLSSAVSSKTGSATIKWKQCAGAIGYQVLYSTSKSGIYKNAGNTTGQSFTINKLTKGKTYYFKVRAYISINNTAYYGAYSQVKDVKIK